MQACGACRRPARTIPTHAWRRKPTVVIAIAAPPTDAWPRGAAAVPTVEQLGDEDWTNLVTVADKIPESLVLEDEQLLMYYEIARERV